MPTIVTDLPTPMLDRLFPADSPVRRLAHAVRHFPDRLAHEWRRAVATHSVRVAKPRRILFLCYGNICRSPFAESVFVQRSAPNVRGTIATRSAGFIGPNRASPDVAIAAAARQGLDLTGHRSELLTKESIDWADLVVVMSIDQLADVRATFGKGVVQLVLGDLDPAPIATRTIEDPWGGSAEVFDDCYARIERCVAELVRLTAEP